MRDLSKKIALGVMLAACAVLAAAASAGAGGDKKGPGAKKEETVVPTILSVDLKIDAKAKKLEIKAVGEVPTGGWSDAKLVKRTYIQPLVDGFWEYDFYAKPPDGPATQVISKINASATWDDFSQGKLKGIRVYGVGAGKKEATFPEMKSGK